MLLEQSINKFLRIKWLKIINLFAYAYEFHWYISSDLTDTTMPPFAVPSSFVSTIPSTPTASVKCFACETAFCPVVASSTSNVSTSEFGSSLLMIRLIFSVLP